MEKLGVAFWGRALGLSTCAMSDLDTLPETKNTSPCLGPVVLFSLALVLYALTLCRIPFPGESIRSLLQHWGQHPFVPMDYPVWGWMQRCILKFAGEESLLWAHGFAAVLGALNVGLLYYFAASLSRGRSSEERVLAPESLNRINQFSGVSAALFFAVSTPVWVASTRAYPLLWGALLFLIWLCALKGTVLNRSVKMAWVLAFITGLGLAEYSAFVLAAPISMLVLAWVIYSTTLAKRLNRALIITGLFVLGTLPLLHTLFTLRDGPMAPYMAIDGLGSAAHFLLRDRMFKLSSLLPQTGWLIVSLQGAIPLLIILVPKRILERRLIWGSYVLHAVLTLILVLGFLNVPYSPWQMLKFKPFMLLPALFTAIALGYLVGYWLGVCLGERKFDHPVVQGLRWCGRKLTVPLALGLVVWGAVQNFKDVDGNNGALVNAWVQQVCEDGSDYDWMISDGPADEVLLYYTQNIDAYGQRLMSDQLGNKRWLMEYYAGQFDHMMIQNMGRLPLWPFVQAWFKIDPSIKHSVYFANSPQVKFPVVVEGMGYVVDGSPNNQGDAPFRDTADFLMRLTSLEKKGSLDRNPYAPMNSWVLRQASMTLNNHGVGLENAGLPDQAGPFYEQALALDAVNISALMNLGLWAERRGDIAQSSSIKDRLAKQLDNFSIKQNIWHLSKFYGHVHHPAAYMDRGMAWAVSGDTKQARNELTKVLAIDPDHKQARQLRNNLLIFDEAGEDAEKELVHRINQNPNDLLALRGLFQLRVLQKEFAEAEALLFRLTGLVGKHDLLAMDEAALFYCRGDVASAEKVLSKNLTQNPGEGRIALALAQLLVEQGREQEVEALLVTVLQSLEKMGPQEIVVTAKLLKSLGKVEHSRLLLDRMAKAIAHYQPGLRFYLELQMESGNRAGIDRVLDRLLILEPNDPYGLFVMGYLHFEAGELGSAQAAWERSVALEPTAGSLNSLAYVMHLRGRSLAALPLVQRALDLDPLHAPAWDTLGVICLEQNQYSQALMALKKSLAIDYRDANVLLHLVEVYQAIGRLEEAQALLEGLRSQYSQMSLDTRARYDALR